MINHSINHLSSVGDRLKTIRNLVFFGLSEGSINILQVCVSFNTTTAALTMVFKLYGINGSPWVRLVAAILHEKKVPFELVSVDLANGEHKSPEYLAKHPFGQVPYIVCDSLNLFASSSIYLCSQT
jgi:glutaredoxin